MTSWLPRSAILATVLVLAGCGNDSLTRTFGLTRDAPDEFLVTTRAPLSMPPDYELRPPRPGATRPQEQSSTKQAEEVLVPNVALGADQGGASPGQQALVAAAGPPAPQDVRTRVNADSTRLNDNQSFVDELMFWRPAPQPGTVVDPAREAQRLRQDAALGQSPQVGDTPIIQPQRSGGGPLDWLQNLF